MRIAFFAFGTRGDVEPFVALAKGFSDAGHEVRFITDEGSRSLVAPYGIDGYFVPGNFRERWTQTAARRTRYSRFPYQISRALSRTFAEFGSSWALEAAEAAQGSRLLMTSVVNNALGFAIAEKIRAVPCEASVWPMTSSRYLPPTLLPWPSAPIPGTLKRLLQEAAFRAAWLGARDVANGARRALGLEEVPWPFGRSRPLLLDGIPKLYGFSPTLIPPPPDWPKNITVTGFWPPRSAAWEPPEALSAFLAAGPPPIYVGFGSMFEPRPEELRAIVDRAVRELGLRAIVATGWGAMAEAGGSSDVFVIDGAPHDWLFPRVAAAVHHGGSGTVGAVLRAGTPSVIVPYLVDQPFWGWALQRLGVAPRMIPRWRLSVGALKAALTRALDERMRRRAREVGEIVRAEDGVRRAVEAVEAWLSPVYAGSGFGPRPVTATAGGRRV